MAKYSQIRGCVTHMKAAFQSLFTLAVADEFNISLITLGIRVCSVFILITHSQFCLELSLIVFFVDQ